MANVDLLPPGRFAMPNRLLPRLLDSLRQLGWLDTALLILSRALASASGGRWRLHKYRFVAQAVAPGSLCMGRGQAYHARLCHALADLPPGGPERPAAALAARYAQGAVCLVLLRDTELAGSELAGSELACSKLAGYAWLLRGACQEDEVRARFVLPDPASNWDCDVWIAPAERAGLAFARLWEEVNAVLHLDHVRWTCSRISAFNPASLHAHARIGTVRLGTATFVRCAGWQWMFASRAPYWHLSRAPASFPSLAFDTSALGYFPSMELTCRILKP